MPKHVKARAAQDEQEERRCRNWRTAITPGGLENARSNGAGELGRQNAQGKTTVAQRVQRTSASLSPGPRSVLKEDRMSSQEVSREQKERSVVSPLVSLE